MRRFVTTTLALLILSPAALWGAEATESQNEAEKPAQDTAAREPAAQEAQQTQRTVNAPSGQSPDIFVPTDEISEDLSVSYPVDI